MGGFEKQIEAVKLRHELATKFKGSQLLLAEPSLRKFPSEGWKVALHIEEGENAFADTVKELGALCANVLIYNPTLVEERQLQEASEQQAA